MDYTAALTNKYSCSNDYSWVKRENDILTQNITILNEVQILFDSSFWFKISFWEFFEDNIEGKHTIFMSCTRSFGCDCFHLIHYGLPLYHRANHQCSWILPWNKKCICLGCSRYIFIIIEKCNLYLNVENKWFSNFYAYHPKNILKDIHHMQVLLKRFSPLDHQVLDGIFLQVAWTSFVNDV